MDAIRRADSQESGAVDSKALSYFLLGCRLGILLVLLHKSLDEVKLVDIEQLVSDRLYEARELDWKKTLPDKNSSSRKEFARDVAGMLNAVGGDIIFGVEESQTDGTPSIVGVEFSNWDDERLRLQSIILNGIQPHVMGLDIQNRVLPSGRHLVIVRVPKSFYGPHMVTLDGDNRFYLRHPGGRHPMDISEIRHSFVESEAFIERARSWSSTRVESISQGKGSLRIEQGPAAVLHMVPLIGGETNIDFGSELCRRIIELPLLGLDSVSDGRHNLDGYVSYKVLATREHKTPSAYLQAFRDGKLESVSSYVLATDSSRFLYFIGFERSLISRTQAYLQFLEGIGVHLPLMVRLSLLNVANYGMKYQIDFHEDDVLVPRVFDSNILLFPELLLKNWNETRDTDKFLKPLIDMVWNACGWEKSPSYDEEGRWQDISSKLSHRF